MTWPCRLPVAVLLATSELLMCDWRFWHLFLSIYCIVFLNALCPSINYNHVALLGLVVFKVLFSVFHCWWDKNWLAAVLMVGDTAGQSEPKQWSAKCETMLNQGWSSDAPRWVNGMPKPDFLDLSHLKWTNSSWIGSCLISYTNTCSDHKFCFVPMNDHLRWIIWNSI